MAVSAVLETTSDTPLALNLIPPGSTLLKYGHEFDSKYHSSYCFLQLQLPSASSFPSRRPCAVTPFVGSDVASVLSSP